jgi:putative membrane-bound dehydrogenase-like protein
LLDPSTGSAAEVPVGVAKVDITPDYPVRLSGYGSRRTEHEGIEQRIWAKALVIGSDSDGPALLLTVDNCGVPDSMRTELARRLAVRTKVTAERIAICSSHSHSAPMLAGVLPNLFSMDIPPEHMPPIERYTRELADKLDQVSLAALTDRQPAQLAFAQGKAGFAKNRRNASGPVDHDVPLLRVTLPDGKLRAVLANYACHCTTLGGDFNKVCGDWATFAGDAIEREHPGATALIAIGCGADSNPQARTGVNFAKQHGGEIAAEVKRLLAAPMEPVSGSVTARTKRIELPFAPLPARAEWEVLAAGKSAPIAYHAKKNLARLDRGEKLPTHLPYLVAAWSFGADLAMVFLPGEVVVDYSLRLKEEFDPRRMWVNAYANDVPCYIPSRSVLTEGGYEGGGAMVYYDRPTKFAPEVEELIIGAVRELVPKEFLLTPKQAEFPPPRTAGESLGYFKTKPGLEIELVVTEPLVLDPVAMDWGADGKLYVVEMRDYPMGMDGNWKPGGRVRLLESTKGDGRYDKATVFLDGLPFPTGVTAWGKGALVCAAPDIFYAEDTNGDGVADKVEKVFSGFITDNYQARVNSLSLGLDNWIYGANGLRGGVIVGQASRLSSWMPGIPTRNETGGTPVPLRATVDIRGRDFRINPWTGSFEPVSGLTQQGRVRDDFGNWFGCNNSVLLMNFPLADHYIRRNPHVPAPNPSATVPYYSDHNRLYPISRTLTRYNNPGSENRTTSACGLGIYRDDLLGSHLQGNAFICEPVHNMVHRLRLEPAGATWSGFRPDDEKQSEFLASRDNWFRPAQVRTGPDGALWVADMYRYLIEHPRWVPPDRMAEIDARAGDNAGRIYRIVPRGKKLRPVADLTKLETPQLVAALDTPNGTVRDLVHQQLLLRRDTAAVSPLEELIGRTRDAAVQVQGLCMLDGLGELSRDLVSKALGAHDPRVRREAIRLAEPQRMKSPPVIAALLRLVDDPDPGVRFQLALSLGEWDDDRATTALARLAKQSFDDGWLRAAVVTSATREPFSVMKSVMEEKNATASRNELLAQLTSTAAGSIGSSPEKTRQLADALGLRAGESPKEWQLVAFSEVLERISRPAGKNAAKADAQAKVVGELVAALAPAARKLLADSKAPGDARLAALRYLGRDPAQREADSAALRALLEANNAPALQQAAVASLGRVGSADAPALFLGSWPRATPSLRSAMLNALLARAEWIPALLDAVEKGDVSPGEVPVPARQQLAAHKDASLAARAAKRLPVTRVSRAEALAKFADVPKMKGDPVKGTAIFDKQCAQCHEMLRGHGHAVGPGLTALSDKSPQDFLVAVLDPNAAIEPRFAAYFVETKDGRSFSGVISGETATSLTVVQAGGLKETLLRTEISAIRASELSLMPEGLEGMLTPQDMADLIAFLKAGREQ